MSFIRGQLPAYAQARAEAQAQQENAPDPLQALGQSLSEGMGQGLEQYIGEYFDRKRDTQNMEGASALLESLGKGDYDLQDILKKGREMGVSPDSMRMAMQIGTTSSKMRQEREALKGQRRQQMRASPEYKSAVDAYNEDINVGQSADNLMDGLDVIEKLIPKGSGSLASLGADTPYIGRIASRAESAEAKKLRAQTLDLVGRYKEIFKGRITDTDLRVIQDALPSPKNSADQNRALLEVQRAILSKYVRKAQMARDLRQQYGDIPMNYQEIISSQRDPQVERAITRARKSGVDIGGDQQAQEASPQKAGGKVRVKSPSGKDVMIDADKVDAYIAKYGGSR